MVRLEPLTEAEFQESIGRAIPRHAESQVVHGLWIPEHALEASRGEFHQLLPQGRQTPHFHFLKVLDEPEGALVGETWYSVEEQGGKVQFWVHWIWVDPALRRRGFATQILRRLAEIADEEGAERMGLSVLADNTPALTLYRKLGFADDRLRMSRPVRSVPWSGDASPADRGD